MTIQTSYFHWITSCVKTVFKFLWLEQPNLVLLDIMMPDVDGYQICAHIKNSTALQATQVIFMSAKSKDADIQKGLDMGAVAYFTKPFSSKQLLIKVQELLQ